MTLLQHETELGSYCNANCRQGDDCNCDLGSPYAGDWLDEYPLLCSVLAVAVVAVTVLVSSYFPLGWFQ